MTFPVYFYLLGARIHAHPVFEVLAYAAGVQLFLYLRERWKSPGPTVSFEQSMYLLCGCVIGALVGSRVLAWLESPMEFWALRHLLVVWVSGKTIVGGLLGGWLGVEIVKTSIGIKHSTGDMFVFPLILGMSIGRIGCFLTGLEDHTFGLPTSMPWGIDFGDGIPRHPTQLYDIVFLGALAAALFIKTRMPWRNGDLFKLFAFSYFTWRFSVEFIKPRYLYGSLSAIQIASLIGAVWAGAYWIRRDADATLLHGSKE